MQFSEAEWKVMNAVWSQAPASAREVLAALPEDTAWAYTTVKTMLSRLVEKGAIEAEMQGNTSIYRPLISCRDARRSAVKGLLQRAFDGAFGPLMQFLIEEEKLSAKDRKRLEELLAERRSRRDGADG